MSWRWLFAFVIFMLGASAAAGVALGNWLVDSAPGISADPRTNTTRLPETVLDAAGRPLTSEAPQPLLDGTLGVPQDNIQPMWEVQAVSLFETTLDPMVVLSRGDESYTVADMLSEAGSGLASGPNDIATVDVTVGAQGGETVDQVAQLTNQSDQRSISWQVQLEQAVTACDKVGFFSRPDCIDRARKKYCEPNQGWGRHRLCPSQTFDLGS
jgi:hypothetical protein